MTVLIYILHNKGAHSVQNNPLYTLVTKHLQCDKYDARDLSIRYLIVCDVYYFISRG